MIKYTYNVTNSGNSAVSNARIVDDKLGQIDDGPFGLESGESESFEKTVYIFKDTTNVATVTGNSVGDDGDECSATSNSVTVTVEEVDEYE